MQRVKMIYEYECPKCHGHYETGEQQKATKKCEFCKKAKLILINKFGSEDFFDYSDQALQKSQK